MQYAFPYMTDNRRVKAVYWEVDFMSVSVSGSVSSIKDVTIATTGKGEPNWSYIPSAGKSNKSIRVIILTFHGIFSLLIQHLPVRRNLR